MNQGTATAAEPATEKPIEVIDIRQTWENTLKYILVLYTDGNPAGREYAKEQLFNMAKIADLYVAEHPELH